MHYTEQVLQAHPMGDRVAGQITTTIRALADNATACHACADACLHEDMVKELVQCIERDVECATSCEATVSMLLQAGSTNQRVWQVQLDACAEACSACAEECDKHAQMHEHCRVCAESCREAEHACKNALAEVVTMANAFAMA